MKLLADSGSTKTSWVLLEGHTVVAAVSTTGMNPYFLTHEMSAAILASELLPCLPDAEITEIHFYGAGCSTENNNRIISDPLRKLFPQASVHILHDILGAARALFGKERGVACILGTGCNSCYYDGTDVESRVPSLGYFYGDEGAGSYLGKTLLGHYLKNRLPAHLRKEFENQYPMTLEDILNSIYNRPNPNRWFASFSEFIAPRQADAFLNRMVRDSFDAFLDEHVARYEEHADIPVGFVGSIAHFYKDILVESTRAKGFTVGLISRSPLEGLIRYHTAGY